MTVVMRPDELSARATIPGIGLSVQAAGTEPDCAVPSLRSRHSTPQGRCAAAAHRDERQNPSEEHGTPREAAA